jgi:recombination protein RecA
MSTRDPSRKSHVKDLAAAVAGIEKKFGVGALQRVGSLANTNVETLPTGIAALDSLLGVGGWPRGRICEVFGPECVGVTTLLLQSLSAAQERGGIVAFVDVDHGLVAEYARRVGCRVEEIFIAQPDDGPMAQEIVDALVRSGAFDLIVLDSVPGLYSRQADDDQAGGGGGDAVARARLLSEAMRRLAANIDRTRTVVLFGVRLAGESVDDDDARTPGGRALRFYSSVRLALRRGSAVQDSAGLVGMMVHATTVKNKVAPPLRKTTLKLAFAHGFI